MNRERTIHAFLTFINFFVVKVSHETHKQKDFFLSFLLFQKIHFH